MDAMSPGTRLRPGVAGLLFLLGIGAGWLVAAARTPPPPSPSPFTRSEPTPDVAAAPIPPPDDLRPRDLRAIVVGESEPTGDGTIRGTVRTRAGDPIPGVTVRAIPDLPDTPVVLGAPPPSGDPLRPEIEGEVRRMIHKRRGTREAVSCADGTFVLSGLGVRAHRVRAYREGWIFPGRTPDALPGDVVTLVGRPVVFLSVDVLGPDDRPVAWATLNIRATGRWGEMNRTWTPAHRRIALEPGPIRIRAFAGDGNTLAAEEVCLTLAPCQTPAPIVLRLLERTGIRGTITFPPVAVRASLPYTIVALRIREAATVDPRRLLRERHREVRSFNYSPRRGTGRFTLTDLTPGIWLVGVLKAHKDVVASARVRIESGMRDTTLTVPFPGADEAVTARVLGPDGRPHPGRDLHVQAVHRAEDGSTTSGPAGVPTEEGAFRVSLPRPRDGAAGRIVLQVRSGEFGRLDVEVAPGATETTVRFENPATLAVLLSNYVGSRYEALATLTVTPVGGRESFPREQRPDPHGRTVFGPLTPGEWVVRLAVDRGDQGREVVESVRVQLSSGPREMVLRPPPLFDLTVDTSPSGGWFRLEPTDGRRWAGMRTTADGRALFLRLLAGDYVLWRSGARGEPAAAMPLSISGDRNVTFREVRLDALRVSIRDPAGLLAAAGFVDEDRIVAVDGRPIEDARLAWALLTPSANGGDRKVTVLRGGDRLVLPLDVEAIRDPRKAGGTLRPCTR